jgi:hypothetical protein
LLRRNLAHPASLTSPTTQSSHLISLTLNYEVKIVNVKFATTDRVELHPASRKRQSVQDRRPWRQPRSALGLSLPDRSMNKTSASSATPVAPEVNAAGRYPPTPADVVGGRNVRSGVAPNCGWTSLSGAEQTKLEPFLLSQGSASPTNGRWVAPDSAMEGCGARSPVSSEQLQHQTTNLGVRSSNLFGRFPSPA